MKDNKSRKVHEAQEINDYRELLKMVEEKYSKNIAYKYKKDPNAKEVTYIEKTYQDFIDDIKAFSTGLLNLELEGKKVILFLDEYDKAREETDASAAYRQIRNYMNILFCNTKQK